MWLDSDWPLLVTKQGCHWGVEIMAALNELIEVQINRDNIFLISLLNLRNSMIRFKEGGMTFWNLIVK